MTLAQLEIEDELDGKKLILVKKKKKGAFPHQKNPL